MHLWWLDPAVKSVKVSFWKIFCNTSAQMFLLFKTKTGYFFSPTLISNIFRYDNSYLSESWHRIHT